MSGHKRVDRRNAGTKVSLSRIPGANAPRIEA